MRVAVVQKGQKTLPYSIGGDLGVRLHPFRSLIITPTLWYLQLQQEFVYVGDDAVVEPSGKSDVTDSIWVSATSRWIIFT